MNNISHAQRAKQEKVLDTKVYFTEGLMTRRDWLILQKQNGSTVRESTKPRNKFSRTKFNRMMGADQQKEYERKCFEEKVICFELVLTDRSFYEITKTEFNFFNQLK